MGTALSAETRIVVSIVLITWNSASFLERCLAGVAAQTHRDFELIAVDNGSIDDSVARVVAAFPEVRSIRNQENRGFTGAVNQGIRAARGELVLLLNPDAFLEPGYVAILIEALAEVGPAFGAATGKLLHGTGRAIEPTTIVDSKGIRMTRTGRHFDIAQGEPDSDVVPRGLRSLDGTRLFEVFGVSGAAAMYRMSFLRDAEVEGQVLDEDFFTYREDADLAWRGRIFGWRALYVPAAVGYHVRTVTPQRRRQLSPIVNMHSVKNRFLLRIKNEGIYLALRNAPFELPRDLIAVVAVLTIERTSFPGLRWIMRNFGRVWKKRREIQRRRRVSDRALAGWFR